MKVSPECKVHRGGEVGEGRFLLSLAVVENSGLRPQVQIGSVSKLV